MYADYCDKDRDSNFRGGGEGGTCQAMMLGNFMVGGVLLIWIKVRQGTSVLAVGAGGVGVDIFSLIYYSLSFSPSLLETARYRLKYCLKGAFKPKPIIYSEQSPLFITFRHISLCQNYET